MHARPGAHVREIIHRHMPAERRHVAEDRIVAHMAIVRHVHVCHEHVAVADGSDATATMRPTMDGDEFPEDVALPDGQTRLLSLEFQVLRYLPDRRKRKDLGLV